MNFGYKFKEKSPYFCITIYPAFNEYSNVTEAADKESLMLTYYFTKAQLLELKSMLSEESIAKALLDVNYVDEDEFEFEAVSDEYDDTQTSDVFEIEE